MDTENFNMNEHPVEIKKINDKIYVVGLCWENKTDKNTKMNNIHEVVGYLKQKFGNKFFLARFSNKIFLEYEKNTNDHENPTFVDIKAKFNKEAPEPKGITKKTNVAKDGYFSQIFCHSSKIEDIFHFCKLASGWLFDDHVIVIENRNKKFCSLYVQSLLYYLKMEPGKIKESKQVLQNLKIISDDFRRNIEEFRIISKKGNFEKLKIVQIIVSNFKIKGDIYFKINNARCGKIELFDGFYIIAKFDVLLEGETMIDVYRNDSLLLKIELNAYAYEEGLYRFTSGDFIYSNFEKPNSAASDALTKEKEIIVDIILFKIGTIKNIYESKTNIQMLIDDFENEIDPLKLKNLLSAGYDPNYSKIALMMHQNQPEVENFLEKKAENNIERDYLVAHKKETIEKSDPKISVSYREFCDSDVIKSRACLDARPFKSTTTEVFETLELLPDSIKVKKENVRKRMPILKKKMNSNEKVPKKLAKPFHWVATSSIPGSIFTEMESVKTEINFDLFERWFCGTKKQEEALFSQPLSSINDQKRLFLVSLSLKNLEKRSLETSRDFMKLSLEDLKLAQTIVPKNEEMSRFGENLSEIDEKMIKFKQFETLIDILIFERRFIINFSALENSLGLIEKAVHALNSSKRITKLFKTILDLGNCINYRYGTKYREFTAFKISTLNIIPQYKSRYKGYTLMSFLALTLRKDTDFREIFRELNPIYLAKNQDLGIVKERINEFIVLYEKYKPDLGGIDECVYNDIFSFFSYFYTCMKRFSDRYLSLLKAINDLKTRFNEDDKIKINEILKSMSDFLILLEGELL